MLYNGRFLVNFSSVSFLLYLSHFLFSFYWNLVSSFRLKFVSCERIWNKGNIWNSPLPHTLKCPLTFNCWYYGCQRCWRYTLTLSLSLVFPLPVSPICSSLHFPQMTTYMRLKLSHGKRFERCGNHLWKNSCSIHTFYHYS